MAYPHDSIKKFPPPKEGDIHSVGEVLDEVGTSLKHLLQSEVDLARAEIKDSAANIGRHSIRAAAFGALLSMSVLPFLGFLVIGLGRLLGDNYWLSSLITAVVCGGVGGPLAYNYFKKVIDQDISLLSLPRTRHSLQEKAEVLTHKLHEVKEAAQTTFENKQTSNKRRAL